MPGDVLRPEIIPFLARHWTHFPAWQCNASCGKSCKEFLNVNGVNVLPWPARSPELTCIEHLWDELGRRVRHRVNLPQTLPQLERVLTEEWRRTPMRPIRRLT